MASKPLHAVERAASAVAWPHLLDADAELASGLDDARRKQARDELAVRRLAPGTAG